MSSRKPRKQQIKTASGPQAAQGEPISPSAQLRRLDLRLDGQSRIPALRLELDVLAAGEVRVILGQRLTPADLRAEAPSSHGMVGAPCWHG